MKLKLILGAALAGVCASCAPSAQNGAGSDAVQHDVQCLTVTGLLMRMGNPKVKNAANMGAMYFIGKIFGENPNIDLKAALASPSSTITKANIAAIAKQCGDELTSRGGQFNPNQIAAPK